MYDVIIIGGGPAGLTACLYASRSGLNTLIIEAGAPGGKLNYSAEIENYPGEKKLTGPELAFSMYEHALSFGGTLVNGQVKSIDDHGDYKEVSVQDKSYQGKTVLISTGTKERKMGLEKEDDLMGRGISYCAICDGPFFRNQEVAVIGGGNSALEESIYLTKFVSKVHLIVRRDVFRADKIIQDQVLENDKIEIHFLKKPYEILSEDNKVCGLKIIDSNTDEISELKISAIFPYVGAEPIGDFAPAEILDENGYIITDETMATKISGIYAAGDVRQKHLRQVVTAASDGATAADQITRLLQQ